jgi:predicted DNA-binding protein
MIELKIDPQMERRLAILARERGESVDQVALQALEAYLEDAEDYARAVAALEELDPSQVISLQEMKRELGLED